MSGEGGILEREGEMTMAQKVALLLKEGGPTTLEVLIIEIRELRKVLEEVRDLILFSLKAKADSAAFFNNRLHRLGGENTSKKED